MHEDDKSENLSSTCEKIDNAIYFEYRSEKSAVKTTWRILRSGDEMGRHGNKWSTSKSKRWNKVILL